MACQLVIKRRTNAREIIGDAISAHVPNESLGLMVEKLGGAFVIIDISDADKDHTHLVKITSQWKVNDDYHDTYEREFNLYPSVEGDEFFNDLITTGRVGATIQQVIDRTVGKV